MKRNRLITLGALAVALLAGNASCIKDFSDEMPAPRAEGFAVSFGTGLQGFTTRVAVEEAEGLREDYVDHVDVFIFDGTTGQIVADGNGGTCYWHVGAQQMEAGQTQTGTLLDGDWKDAPLSGTDYDVYVVANLHVGNPALANVQSLADLQTVIETDADIYKAEGGRDSGNNTYADKLFTMTGKVENFNPQSVQEDEYVLPVTLTRVAAKIEISVALTEEFLQEFRPQSFTQQLKNYASTALLLEGHDDTHAYEPLSSPGYAPALVQNLQAGTATLVLYTYPTEWTADILRETYVILNIPGTRQNPAEGQQAYTGSNYYKIPLRAVADAKQLERNHIYRVQASVNMMGTYTPDTPVELKTVKYEVAEWVDEDVTITGENPHYLLLSETEIIMKNIEDYDDLLKFTSSSDVEIVDGSISAYYYDAEGDKQDVSYQIESQISVTADNGLEGFIDIHSPLPTNNGIRYITFTVQNEQGDTENVKVKQYPLEYITAIEGWFSYRDDFKERDPYPTTYKYAGDRITSNGTFQSKVWYNNQIMTYSWNRWSDEVQRSNYNAGTDNNRMYHIVITKTSDQYTLAVPIKDQNGDTNEDDDNANVVSPSFMLASRLGLVTADDYDFAVEHCRNYVETVRREGTEDVAYTYDDWRLPTKAELMLIDRFQNTEGSVIITILNKSTSGWLGSTAYYWGAGGRYETNTDGDNTIHENHWSARTNGSAFIRCIRDVSPNEPINSEPE